MINNKIYIIGILILLFIVFIGTILLLINNNSKKIIKTQIPVIQKAKPSAPLINFDIISGGVNIPFSLLPKGIKDPNLKFNKNLIENQIKFWVGDNTWDLDNTTTFYIYDNGVSQSFVDFDKTNGKEPYYSDNFK